MMFYNSYSLFLPFFVPEIFKFKYDKECLLLYPNLNDLNSHDRSQQMALCLVATTFWHIPYGNLTFFKVVGVIIIPSVSNEFMFCKNIYLLNMIDTENNI